MKLITRKVVLLWYVTYKSQKVNDWTKDENADAKRNAWITVSGSDDLCQ